MRIDATTENLLGLSEAAKLLPRINGRKVATSTLWRWCRAATELRKEFGLEAARVILGHRSAAITEVYAEMDRQKAIDAMMKVG
ncbi:MAG: hypothetical protein K8S55_08520 [Phycisphaerae bacterium]|nr:hypothetical protein [Phycisphaerae bacterium]